MDPRSFIPLRAVELDILLSAAEEPRHGYGILKHVEERTNGHPGFEVPTLYRALRRLREQGLIRSFARGDPSGRRQYWQATALGGRVLLAELERLESVLADGRDCARRLRRASA